MLYVDTYLEGVFTVSELKICILMFADDAVLFLHILQKHKNIDLYCQQWGLTIYTNKTKVMVFERGRSTGAMLRNTQLEDVTSFKYLGHICMENSNVSNQSSFALHNHFIFFSQIES